MRNLFTLFWKQYFFFLFLILEIIAFILLIQNNYYHNASFINSANQITGSVFNVYSNISEYFSLKKVNKILSEENASLRYKTINSFDRIGGNIILINDTLYKQKYQYINAKVINNSVNKRNNYLTLNKGKNNGVKKDMAVISSNGIVGIVKDVSNNFCSVISILHKEAGISAKIKKNGYMGNIIWEGKNYRTGTLKDIPAHVNLSHGDTIITSGYSSIFPEGIPIGTINSCKVNKGDNFHTISFDFSEDYNSLSYVYIVVNLSKEEKLKLEKSSQKDE